MSVPASFPTAPSLAQRFRARAARRAGRERRLRAFVGIAAALVVVAVIGIPVFLLSSAGAAGWRAMALWPLLLGSLKAAVCAMLVAVPLGLGGAVWCARFAAPPLRAWLKPLFEVFEAVPAVVLGVMAALILAPWLMSRVVSLALFLALLPLALAGAGAFWRRWAPPSWQRRSLGWEAALCLIPISLLALLALAAGPDLARGWSATWLEPTTPWNGLVVGLVLGLACMPTIFTLAEDALFDVPAGLVDGAQALGATRWQALRMLVLPVAAPGILAALLLGLSRALGETMIVLMASGNTPLRDANPLTGLRSVAANLALEAPEALAGSERYSLLLTSALLLFGLCFALNSVAELVRVRLRRRLVEL